MARKRNVALRRGKNQYVPFIVIDELADIKREDSLNANAEAYRKLVKYARVGREVKRIATLDFTRAKPRKRII